MHFAADSHVVRSIADPDAFVATNIMGTHSMLAATKKVWIDEGWVLAHRVHQLSTDEVYGSRGDGEPSANEFSA